MSGDLAVWMCTRETTKDGRVLDEPFIATNRAYVEAHPLHDWAPLYSQATVDTLRAQLEAAEAEVERWHQQSELHKHMVITCGVAATHSDPNLTLTGAYKEKWNSQQADSVRALRARAEAAEAECAAMRSLIARVVADTKWRSDDNTLWPDLRDAARTKEQQA